MSMLCISTDLTSQEIAAWVQALGSIAAIIAATSIAIWQGNKQHRNALDLHSTEKKYERVELAKTLCVLAKSTSNHMSFLTKKLDGRESIYKISEGQTPFDIGGLKRLNTAIADIPLHELPDTLVTLTIMLNSTIRQFLERIELVLRVHRKMDAAAFEDFFKVLGEMNKSFEYTCDDIAGVLLKLEKST